MSKHSTALDIDESIKVLFVIGERFPIEIERVSRQQLIEMIETFTTVYPVQLQVAVKLVDPEQLKTLDAAEYMIEFARIVSLHVGEFQIGSPLAFDKMALSIFLQLLMFCRSKRLLQIDNYEQSVSLAQDYLYNWSTQAMMIDKTD